jgi:CubicO group peptidase (beta-lactamase class C family)
MTSTVRLGLLAIVAVLSLATRPSPDDLDAFIQAHMAQRQINGLSLAIIQDGRIDARAYGVIAAGGAPVTTATLFQAGSISKPVAAVGAMRLVEQGRLSLDQDVNARLSSWKVPQNEFTRTEKVTLRRLLSHTAGLTVSGFPGYPAAERIPSVADVLDGRGNTAPIRVNVVPGTTWRYSGGGYTVMQQLVSEAAGKPFAHYMNESVLVPAGMTSSTYQQPPPANLAARGATAHSADRSAVAGNWHVYPELAAAGLWTTPTDLARFAIEIQHALAGTSTKLISQATARQMLTVEMSDYALGFAVTGTGTARTFGHNGRNRGFDAAMRAFAESGRGVVIMINANDNSTLMNRIVQFVGRKYNWPGRSDSAAAATPPVASKAPVEDVAGRYELRNNRMLTLDARDGRMFSYVDGLPDEEFVASGRDSFGSTWRDVSFRISRNAAGEVDGLRWSDGGNERHVPRIGPLFASIKQAVDPDPSLTKTVEAAVRAFAEGGDRVRTLQQLTPGARSNLAGPPVRAFADVRGIVYLSAEDVNGRRIERHGSDVARVLFYRLDTDQPNRWLMVHVTSDNLIADYDVVEN